MFKHGRMVEKLVYKQQSTIQLLGWGKKRISMNWHEWVPGDTVKWIKVKMQKRSYSMLPFNYERREKQENIYNKDGKQVQCKTQKQEKLLTEQMYPTVFQMEHKTKWIYVTYTLFHYIFLVFSRTERGRTTFKLWTLSRRFFTGMSIIIIPKLF